MESKRRAGAFCRDTAALAKRLELRQGDLVFLPNLSLPDVLALARYFRSNNESAGPSWHLLFRRDARYTEDDRRDPLTASGRIRASLKELCASLAGQRVGLYTDTDRLTAQYNGLEVATFSTLCIPVNPAIGPNPNRSLDRPLQIAYLGDARREKGYQLLPDLVEELRDRYLAAGRIRFLIQSNLPRGVADPVILRARTSLRNHDPSHVQLIETPLDPSDYEHAMAESDVIVLPYDPERYQARSSGVFAEALSAAIPVLVPEGTWMSAQLSSSRANDVQETRGVAYARDPGSFLSNLLDG
ncbi:MAG: glycosyltransferase, partial [Chloroflexota bacterium]|nr:glycosyltransferase [Chloroflexota bacterium]